MEILVLTISDRAHKGIYKDLSGPAIEKILKTYYQIPLTTPSRQACHPSLKRRGVLKTLPLLRGSAEGEGVKKSEQITITRKIVPDEKRKIKKAFRKNLSRNIIITTGGTGISPRDVTPEVTEKFCDKMLPGIAEILRAESYKQTPNAMLSRAVAGIKGKTVIINLPGSVKAAVFCTKLLLPVLPHILEMQKGQGH